MLIFNSKAQGTLHTAQTTERSLHGRTTVRAASQKQEAGRQLPWALISQPPTQTPPVVTARSLALHLYRAATCEPEILHSE